MRAALEVMAFGMASIEVPAWAGSLSRDSVLRPLHREDGEKGERWHEEDIRRSDFPYVRSLWYLAITLENES